MSRTTAPRGAFARLSKITFRWRGRQRNESEWSNSALNGEIQHRVGRLAPSGARAGTGGQDPNTVNFQNLHKKVVVYRAPRCEHERTQLECFAKRLPMYEVKFTVGGIGRLLPVATSLLVLGLFVIWTAAAHSQ